MLLISVIWKRRKMSARTLLLDQYQFKVSHIEREIVKRVREREAMKDVGH